MLQLSGHAAETTPFDPLSKLRTANQRCRPARLLFTVFLQACILACSSAWAGMANPTPTTRTLNNGQLILEDVPEIPPGLVNRLQQYQEVRSAQFVDWVEGGKGMLILTRFGELNQIHRVDFQGGARHQLTYFT